ncbi:UNVERIFIED_CONTAM: hypothetical protein Slati_0959000 [Sesamum latifolium]|uniref:DDE Tnp4 domain-containing protein n=1 Tax=Sesamum latifolium TaxID=2727402 RepID=A0AAW2XQR7_9LAMI
MNAMKQIQILVAIQQIYVDIILALTLFCIVHHRLKRRQALGCVIYWNTQVVLRTLDGLRLVSRNFNAVLKAIIKLHPIFLARPTPISEDCDDPRWKWFKFIYVLTGWEGSAADSRVLREAISRPNGLKVPQGMYYLCDNGYTNGDGFLTPYRGVRYHLRERDCGQGGPQNKEELFNLKHSSARNVIERAFGLLKTRWAILRSHSYYPIKTQNRIIMACFLLHNYIRAEMPEDPLLNEVPEHEETFFDPPLERGRRGNLGGTGRMSEEEVVIVRISGCCRGLVGGIHVWLAKGKYNKDNVGKMLLVGGKKWLWDVWCVAGYLRALRWCPG